MDGDVLGKKVKIKSSGLSGTIVDIHDTPHELLYAVELPDKKINLLYEDEVEILEDME